MALSSNLRLKGNRFHSRRKLRSACANASGAQNGCVRSRRAITASPPLDDLAWSDEVALAKHGLSRSRTRQRDNPQ